MKKAKKVILFTVVGLVAITTTALLWLGVFTAPNINRFELKISPYSTTFTFGEKIAFDINLQNNGRGRFIRQSASTQITSFRVYHYGTNDLVFQNVYTLVSNTIYIRRSRNIIEEHSIFTGTTNILNAITESGVFEIVGFANIGRPWGQNNFRVIETERIVIEVK